MHQESSGETPGRLFRPLGRTSGFRRWHRGVSRSVAGAFRLSPDAISNWSGMRPPGRPHRNRSGDRPRLPGLDGSPALREEAVQIGDRLQPGAVAGDQLLQVPQRAGVFRAAPHRLGVPPLALQGEAQVLVRVVAVRLNRDGGRAVRLGLGVPAQLHQAVAEVVVKEASRVRVCRLVAKALPVGLGRRIEVVGAFVVGAGG